MKISKEDMKEMISDLRIIGRRKLKKLKEDIEFDAIAASKDLELVKQLSDVVKHYIGWDSPEERIIEIYKSEALYKFHGDLKSSYKLKDEIMRLAPKATSFTEIINFIDPIEL